MAQYSKGAADRQVILDLKVNAKEALSAIVEAQDAIQKLKEEQKELAKAMKDGTATKEQKERYALINAEIKDLTNTMKANQKELDDNIKMSKQNGDSINAMRAQLSKLRREYEDLSKVDREGDVGQGMLSNIDSLTNEILELEKAQGDYTRQVGNYELASKPARQALKEMKMECQNLAVSLTQLEGKMQAQQTIVKNLAATVGTESDEYKEAAAELANLNKQYDQAQASLSQMEQKTGELADTLADSQQRINSFANDQQKIAAMQEGVGALTAAYDVLQGSLTALGFQSEALIEIYAKMQIVQKSVNGLMTIYKALNKDSNLMIVLRNKLEQARLTWTKAYNAALEKQNASVVKNTVAEGANAAATTATTVAEGAATTATFSLKAAFDALTASLAANPITGIAVAIGAAVAAIVAGVSKIIKKNKEAAELEKEHTEQVKKNTEAYKKSIEERAKANDSVNKKYDEQIANIRALLSVLRNEAAAYDTKKKALAEINRLIPEYNGQLSKTGKFIEGNIKVIDDYIAKLNEKAKAEADTELLIQAYLEEGDIKRRQIIAERDKTYYEGRIKIHQNMLTTAQEVGDWETAAAAQKQLDYYIPKLESTKTVLSELSTEAADSKKNIEALQKVISSTAGLDIGGNKTGSNKSDKDKDKDKDEEERDRVKKQFEELAKLSQEFYDETDKICQDSITKQTELENNRYENEKAQLDKAINDANNLLKNEFADKNGVQEVIDQLNNALEVALIEHNKKLAKITEETNKAFQSVTSKLQAELQQNGMNQIDLIRYNLDQQLQALEDEQAAEIAAHEYTEEQITEIKKLYSEKRAKMTEDAAKQEKIALVDSATSWINSLGEMTNGLSQMFGAMAENNEKMQKYTNALAFVDIMISLAEGVASAVAKGMDMGWPAAAVLIPAGIGMVTSAIGQAISIFKQNDKVGSAPTFSYGGLVGDKTTTRKDDTVDAKLSLGEYVIRSEVVKEYGVDFFDRLNKKKLRALAGNYHFANGGLVQTPNIHNYTEIQELEFNYERMGEIFTSAVSEVQPVVSVKEITTKQNRIKTKENISSYK